MDKGEVFNTKTHQRERWKQQNLHANAVQGRDKGGKSVCSAPFGFYWPQSGASNNRPVLRDGKRAASDHLRNRSSGSEARVGLLVLLKICGSILNPTVFYQAVEFILIQNDSE